MDDMRSILMENASKIAADAVIEESKEESVDTPVEETVETTEDKAESSESAKPEKPKRNSLQGRLDSKHAQLMQTKEALDQQKTDNDALLKRLEALENKSEPAPEPEFEINDEEDLAKYLKNMVSKDDIETLIGSLVDKRLSVAKNKIEQESKEQTYKTMEQEFHSALLKYYNPKDNVDIDLSLEEKEQGAQMLELFNGNPTYYLNMAKEHGIGYIRKFVSGELEAEKKADKIKSIIDKADAVKLNKDTHADVTEYKDDSIPKTIKDVFRIGAQKLKKGVT